MKKGQIKNKRPWTNEGEKEFLTSGFGIIAQWNRDTNSWSRRAVWGVIGKAVSDAIKKRKTAGGMAVVVLRKKLPAITPWMVLIEVKSRQMVHLFMTVASHSVYEKIFRVVVEHHGGSQKVADKLAQVALKSYKDLGFK